MEIKIIGNPDDCELREKWFYHEGVSLDYDSSEENYFDDETVSLFAEVLEKYNDILGVVGIRFINKNILDIENIMGLYSVVNKDAFVGILDEKPKRVLLQSDMFQYIYTIFEKNKIAVFEKKIAPTSYPPDGLIDWSEKEIEIGFCLSAIGGVDYVEI